MKKIDFTAPKGVRAPFLLLFLLVTAALSSKNASAAEVPSIAEWKAEKIAGDSLPDQSGHGNNVLLHDVTPMLKVQDLVDHPCLYFNGGGAHGVVLNQPSLNPPTLSVRIWFKVEEGQVSAQVPLLVKSLPVHQEPWYQYGLFLIDLPDSPRGVCWHVGAGAKEKHATALDVDFYSRWTCAAATYDGKFLRVYINGEEKAAQEAPEGTIGNQDTSLLLGAYANLPKDEGHTFEGYLSQAAIYDRALDAGEVRAMYESERSAYPDSRVEKEEDKSEYVQRLNAALREGRDVLGEEALAKGVSQDALKDYLRPLLLSTGFTNKTYGVHSLLFGMDGGVPPYLIPVADGGRIASEQITSPEFIEIRLGPDGAERYGEALERLEGPGLGDGYYPVLQTGYTDSAGTHYRQESFAGHLPGTDNLLAFVKIEADRGKNTADAVTIGVNCGKPSTDHLRGSLPGTWSGNTLTHRLDLSADKNCTLLLVWSPKEALPETESINGEVYNRAKGEWEKYWDGCLARGTVFKVPEASLMDMQRNLLIQNLIMRWRYSLGAVVYHGDYFQPESSDTMTTLGQYGFLSEYRDGLDMLIDVSKGEEYYSNWERGEKLTHGAQYFLLTRDRAFVEKNTEKYTGFCDRLVRQMENDPNGLLEKQRHCGDIPEVAYCTFHQTVCWRGLRDMAEVWGQVGREDLRDKYRPAADKLRDAITRALDQSESTLPDGTLFVPSILLDKEKTVYDPVTKTRMGSYWNLCMPYAFSSGFWPANGIQMDRITGFMRNHGSLLLGLIRFNYYPVEIGEYRAGGLPGYSTTGFDNVYLPGYIRMMADRDEADLLGLSFYAKAVHGQTRGTYVSGEGETVGVRPDQFHRSCYGTPCSANNTVFLMALRLMLVRESSNDNLGMPEGLYLAHGTPRQWLEPGKTIVMDRAPTCFGPVSLRIESILDHGAVNIRAVLPDRDPATVMKLKLRVPKAAPITAVTLNGQPYEKFDVATETIDLSGLRGEAVIVAHYGSEMPKP